MSARKSIHIDCGGTRTRGRSDSNYDTPALPSRLSPFRYPGGKSWLRPTIIQWLKSLPFRPRLFIEPFAGGASVGLAVAELNLADQVLLIELDPEVAAVWKVALGSKCAVLRRRILSFRMSRKSVREVLASDEQDLVSVAFRCLLRNRVQRGGIIAPRAGLLRKGERNRGIQSRWYPQTLATRLKAIHSLRDRIRVRQADSMRLLPRFLDLQKTAAFIDPPYAMNGDGPGLRLYRYASLDHDKLFSLLAGAEAQWITTYHASPDIRRLAKTHGFQASTVKMHTAHHHLRRELVMTDASRPLQNGRPLPRLHLPTAIRSRRKME